MNPIILIFSCAADRVNGREQAIRDTWLPLLPTAYRFIYGEGAEPGKDGECVPADDSYGMLPWKQRAAYRRFMAYEFIFVCYTDTYVIPRRLLTSGFQGCVYTGRRDEEGREFAGGGMGYWLSRPACVVLTKHTPEPDHYSDQSDGLTLAKYGILPCDDKRYGGDLTKDGITAHLSKGTGVYDPNWMRELHRSLGYA